MKRTILAMIVAVALVFVVAVAVFAFRIGLKENQPPDIQPVTQFISFVGLETDFNVVTTTDPDGDTLNFTWNFGDGNASHSRNVSHTYIAHGDYHWMLVVNDGHGNSVTRTGETTVFGYHDLEIGVIEGGRCDWDSNYTDFPFLNVTVWNNASFSMILAQATFYMENSSGAQFWSIDSPIPRSAYPVMTLYPGTNRTWSLMFSNDASGDPVVLKYMWDWLEWPIHWTEG